MNTIFKLGTTERRWVTGPAYGDPLGRGHFEDVGRRLSCCVDWHMWLLGVLVFDKHFRFHIGPVMISLWWD